MHQDDPTSSSVPVKIRTRRTLSGNGDIEVTRSVSCPRSGGELSLHACLARECCAGFGDSALGAYVECDAPELAATQLVHLPLREYNQHRLTHRSRADCTPVSAIMTADVLCVRADVSVDALVPLLLKHGVSGVPVVDASGKPVGVVSKTDLLRERYENGDTLELRASDARDPAGYHESSAGRWLVADVMASMTFSLPEDATVAQACALMAYEGVHRLPIVCAEGKVIGILSALDVLRWVATADGYLLGKRPG